MNTTDFTTVTYGPHSVDLTKIPAVSLHKLASYGLAHFLGNQMHSKLAAWAKKEENAQATDAQMDAQLAEFRAKGLAAISDGTIGAHVSRGTPIDPTEAEMERIARKEVRAVLAENKIKEPKKDKKNPDAVQKVSFPNGDAFTMDELVDRRIAKHGERIRKEAEAVMRAKAREAEKVAKNAGKDLADL